MDTIPSSKLCCFCTEPALPSDPDTWHEIVGWVHGARKDGLSLRSQTGQVAHSECINKAKNGASSEDRSMFDEG